MNELISLTKDHGGTVAAVAVVFVGLIALAKALGPVLRAQRNGRRNGTAEMFTRIEKLVNTAALKSAELHVSTLNVLNEIAKNIAVQTELLKTIVNGQSEARREASNDRRDARKG